MFAKVQQAGAAETELAISAAHGAYKAWAATTVPAREAIFFRAADVLAVKTKEIVDVLIQESGSIAWVNDMSSGSSAQPLFNIYYFG